MAVETFSCFYYGLAITSTNNKINFDEGGAELTATVASGTYNFADLMTAVAAALNSAGALAYTSVVNRTTRVVTIAASGTFSLLTNTGTNVGNDPWSILGFTVAADRTAAATYAGDLVAGEFYAPQFMLQDYQDPETYKERINPAVNESANGLVEVVSFGVYRFIGMSIKFITNLTMDGKLIKNNPTGLSDAVAFLTAIIENGQFEFIPDIDDRTTFYTVIVESLSGSKNGTGFKLKELVSDGLKNIYELNELTLKVIE